MTHPRSSVRGFTLAEVLVAMGIFGILVAAALPHLDMRRQNINTAVDAIAANIRLARTKAMSTGIHYCMHWSTSNKFYVRRWSDNKNIVDGKLPSRVSWSMRNYPDLAHVMFNTRGMTIDNTAANAILKDPVDIYVWDTYGISHKIVVWPSGQIHEQY